jgi:hypothetical protein
MRGKSFGPFLAAAMSAFAAMGCFGQTPAADEPVKQLVEHWRWEQYWNGSTELGPLYRAGREFEALLFWRTSKAPPDLGFCSIDLGVCHYGPTQPNFDLVDRMKISAGEDLRTALKHFSTSAFEEDPHAIIQDGIPDVADLTTELVKITLPPLDPPRPIRDRKAPPQDEVQALVRSLLGCKPDCKAHLLIPYFSSDDPWVPVYFECTVCQVPKTIIRAMWAGEGQWWTPISSWGHDPADVARTRRLIEKALMLEIKR